MVARVDALTSIVESSPGNATSTRLQAVQSGATWTLPSPLASYAVGNRPNTWRIIMHQGAKPPADVTYHTSIMQAFVRTTDYGTGKTYPPTTRR